MSYVCRATVDSFFFVPQRERGKLKTNVWRHVVVSRRTSVTRTTHCHLLHHFWPLATRNTFLIGHAVCVLSSIVTGIVWWKNEMKPMKNVDIRSTFLVCFFNSFFWRDKNDPAKMKGRKKNEETTDKNACHLRVFCFRILRQLVFSFGNNKTEEKLRSFHFTLFRV